MTDLILFIGNRQDALRVLHAANCARTTARSIVRIDTTPAGNWQCYARPASHRDAMAFRAIAIGLDIGRTLNNGAACADCGQDVDIDQGAHIETASGIICADCE